MKKFKLVLSFLITAALLTACGQTAPQPGQESNTPPQDIIIGDEYQALLNVSETDIEQYLINNYVNDIAASGFYDWEGVNGYVVNLPNYYYTAQINRDPEYFKDNYEYDETENCVYVPADVVFRFFSEKLNYPIEFFKEQTYENYIEQKDIFKFDLDTVIVYPKVSLNHYAYSKHKTDTDRTVSQYLNIHFNVYDSYDKVRNTFSLWYIDNKIDGESRFRLNGSGRIDVMSENADNSLSIILGDTYSDEMHNIMHCYLMDNVSGKVKSLGNVNNRNSEVGFYPNGNVYAMDNRGIVVVPPDVNDDSVIFDSHNTFLANINADNFPGKPDRQLLKCVRNKNDDGYIAVYTTYIADDFVFDHCIDNPATYRIDFWDEQGNVIKSWDTKMPVMACYVGFDHIELSHLENNIITMAISHKGKENVIYSGSFNTDTGVFTLDEGYDFKSTDYQKLMASKNPDRFIKDRYLPMLKSELLKDYSDYNLLYQVTADTSTLVLLTAKDRDGQQKTFVASFRYNSGMASPSSTYSPHEEIISKDGKYSLYCMTVAYGDYAIILADNETGKSRLLTRDTIPTDLGFFKNGDIYYFTYDKLNVYAADINDDSYIFTTATNFPCGNGVMRHMHSIRREEDRSGYIVLYSEGEFDDNASRNGQYYPLNINYRVGVLDSTGNPVKSFDTGVPVLMYIKHGYWTAEMFKPADNEVEIFATTVNPADLSPADDIFRGRLNLDTGVYTPIVEFIPYSEMYPQN